MLILLFFFLISTCLSLNIIFLRRFLILISLPKLNVYFQLSFISKKRRKSSLQIRLGWRSLIFCQVSSGYVGLGGSVQVALMALCLSLGLDIKTKSFGIQERISLERISSLAPRRRHVSPHDTCSADKGHRLK